MYRVNVHIIIQIIECAWLAFLDSINTVLLQSTTCSYNIYVSILYRNLTLLIPAGAYRFQYSVYNKQHMCCANQYTTYTYIMYNIKLRMILYVLYEVLQTIHAHHFLNNKICC